MWADPAFHDFEYRQKAFSYVASLAHYPWIEGSVLGCRKERSDRTQNLTRSLYGSPHTQKAFDLNISIDRVQTFYSPLSFTESTFVVNRNMSHVYQLKPYVGHGWITMDDGSTVAIIRQWTRKSHRYGIHRTDTHEKTYRVIWSCVNSHEFTVTVPESYMSGFWARMTNRMYEFDRQTRIVYVDHVRGRSYHHWMSCLIEPEVSSMKVLNDVPFIDHSLIQSLCQRPMKVFADDYENRVGSSSLFYEAFRFQCAFDLVDAMGRSVSMKRNPWSCMTSLAINPARISVVLDRTRGSWNSYGPQCHSVIHCTDGNLLWCLFLPTLPEGSYLCLARIQGEWSRARMPVRTVHDFFLHIHNALYPIRFSSEGRDSYNWSQQLNGLLHPFYAEEGLPSNTGTLDDFAAYMTRERQEFSGNPIVIRTCHSHTDETLKLTIPTHTVQYQGPRTLGCA